MPELAEVEFGRRLAERVAKGRRIERVDARPDTIVFEGTSAAAVARALTGARVEAVRRRGKHLWFELDRRPWPLFHFGMTGAFHVPDEAPLELASGIDRGAAWPPRFTKIHLRFEDGGELAMTNARRLGRIRLRHDPESEPPIAELGWDPLTDRFSATDVAKRLARRGGPIKVVLLDQSLFAGVGNWIADEVLYQAGIDPRRPARDLDADEIRRLCARLRGVVQTAVKVDADKARFPRDWLFHVRWGKGGGRDDPRTRRGEKIAFTTLGGRSTAWVPSRQS